MKIYTGYFAKIRSYTNAGLAPISIARFNPKFVKGVPQYLRLAPTANMLGMDEKEYDRRFEGILSGLKVKIVVEELAYLGRGKDVVLLCYEGIGKKCHRHTVAEWFRKNGVDVEEYFSGTAPSEPKIQQGDLF